MEKFFYSFLVRSIFFNFYACIDECFLQIGFTRTTGDAEVEAWNSSIRKKWLMGSAYKRIKT